MTKVPNTDPIIEIVTTPAWISKIYPDLETIPQSILDRIKLYRRDVQKEIQEAEAKREKKVKDTIRWITQTLDALENQIEEVRSQGPSTKTYKEIKNLIQAVLMDVKCLFEIIIDNDQRKQIELSEEEMIICRIMNNFYMPITKRDKYIRGIGGPSDLNEKTVKNNTMTWREFFDEMDIIIDEFGLNRTEDKDPNQPAYHTNLKLFRLFVELVKRGHRARDLAL